MLHKEVKTAKTGSRTSEMMYKVCTGVIMFKANNTLDPKSVNTGRIFIMMSPPYVATKLGRVGKGGVTEGEFSHKKNPIDIVQNGKKKGEMTGKELIFAPDDVNDMVAIIEEGDGDALIAYMKDLLEEDQFGFDFA